MGDSLPANLLARLTAGLLVLAGVVGCARGLWFPEPGMNPAALIAVGLAASTTGVVAWLLPWSRWPRNALFSLVAAVLVLKTLGNWVGDAGPRIYVVHYVALFMWIGVALPRGSSLICLPFMALSYLLPMLLEGAPASEMMSLAVVAPACVFVAEAAAWLSARTREAEAVSHARASQMAGLVESTLALAACHDIARLAQLTALGAADLFGGSRAIVFLDDPEHGLRRVGDVRWALDAAVTGSLARALESELQAASRGGAGEGALASLAQEHGRLELLPIQGSGKPLGAVVVVPGEDCDPEDDFTRYAARTFATQAGLGFERLRRAEDLRDASMRDELTGVGNRRKAMGALELLKEGDALVLIDLDHFKAVNDNFGHAAGDRVLRTLGSFLSSSVRVPDEVFRFGGEEFLLVLSGSSEGAVTAVERIHAAWGRQERVTGFSAGVAVRGRDEAPDRCLARADAALYAAKRAGRDCVLPYHPEHEVREE